jgi:glycosyltransferase involved in cell wall biosynthesis
MADLSFLPKEVLDELGDIGEVDILVGVPSYNNARTIPHVVKAILGGFVKYFPDTRTLVVNSDGGSKDGTAEKVQDASIGDYRTLLAAHPLRTVHKLITPYHGIPGKGSALRLVFGVAAALGAKACAVVDSDLRSITPEWIDLLVSPVYKEGFDFVAPLYHRHKYDGTITNSIVYPITRALYGKRIRQPIGGDFGFSGRLAEHYLEHKVWDTDVARFGIDIWMTTTAVTGTFKVCQSFLGAKIHDVKDPGVDLSAMLMQVVNAVFSLMESHEDRWREVRGSEAVPSFGFEYTVGLEPLEVNVERMINIFRGGLRDLAPIWEKALAAETLAEVRALAAAEPEDFRFPATLWVRTVYDFAAAYHCRILHREHLLKSLTPLYLARTASFVLETPAAGAEEVEEILESLCGEYERRKDYLAERWTAPAAGGR